MLLDRLVKQSRFKVKVQRLEDEPEQAISLNSPRTPTSFLALVQEIV